MPPTPSSTFELALTGTDTPHQYTAFVPGDNGANTAEHTFEWRSDSVKNAMELGALAGAAISGHPPDNQLHVAFGRRLFDLLFGGPIGELWRERLSALPRGHSLHLIIRPDPATARPLINLPWEYLHDGRGFLSANRRTPISRLPWGLSPAPLTPLEGPLRMLVVISAPLGLNQDQVLNSGREEDLILSVLSEARNAGRIQVEFARNARPETLSSYLHDLDPHILHFVGHGVFDDSRDVGFLLMEDARGYKRQVPNSQFAEIIEQEGLSLRLVCLHACQSAVAPRNPGYFDLAPRLLEVGIPAVVAMQFSVLNRSAMDFGSILYKGIVRGEAVHSAITQARSHLNRSGINTVDFATPVLYLSDPGCLHLVSISGQTTNVETTDLTGLTVASNFVGRSAELRELQTGLDPQDGQWRAAVIHGLGGMGKTVLAARLAQRMAPRFNGITSIRMTPTTTAQQVLSRIGAFLSTGNAYWNDPRIPAFTQVVSQPLPLETKAALLIAILQSLRILIIFDNYEDVLPDGRTVSRAATEIDADAPAQMDPQTSTIDPDLPKLVAILVGNMPGPSRFLFTSRTDFEPVESGRLGDSVCHLSLGQMEFTDAVYLMETLSPLIRLPVAVLQEARPDMPPAPPALSKRDLYTRLGGHPYTITLFAEHARRSSIDAVLADLSTVQEELLHFTMLDRAAASLSERARTLLQRVVIYEEPVPLEGLAFLMGDDQDAMPPVDDEVQSLLSWGLISSPPGTTTYTLHTLVREWAARSITPEESLTLLRRAAQFWYAIGFDSHDLGDYLSARHYLFQAGDYEQANNIVQAAFEYLFRWGQIVLLLSLLHDSVHTLSGHRKAVARGNLAIVYQQLGQYQYARSEHEKVLAILKGLNDRKGEATALHQLGILHQQQGEYEKTREMYTQSLTIRQELGDRAGVANSLHQLGNLYYLQGEYEKAREMYTQSLDSKEELGDRAGVANSLHQLGNLYYSQGEYEKAREMYTQSLDSKEELGDRSGVANSLHQLGILHQDQGDYEQAREMYTQSLAIRQELGDRSGVASSLGQIGLLSEKEGNLPKAVAAVAWAFNIFQELGSPDQHRAGGLLARLREQMGEEAFDAAWKQAIEKGPFLDGPTSEPEQ